MSDGGPYVALAVICETVIEDKEGVLSLIRIVDRVTQTATGPEAPEQMPPFVLSGLTLVIQLRSGQARGRYALRLRPEDPSGIQLPVVELPAHFEGGIRPVIVRAPLNLGINLEGLYWFDVLFAPGGDEPDRLLTRVPLEILYAPRRSP